MDVSITRRSNRVGVMANGRLTISQILAWADEHHDHNRKWPPHRVLRVYSAPHETWPEIDKALKRGERGLSGGSSLDEMLTQHRGLRRRIRPPLTISRILQWADAHHKRTGEWPTKRSGYVHGVVGELWGGIDSDLNKGYRGLPDHSSLVEILADHRGVRTHYYAPPLSIPKILAWADAHRRRTGQWPTMGSGPVHGVPGETWQAIENALCDGKRGFAGGRTLVQILSEHRGRRNMHGLPALTEDQILAWADAYLKRHKYWPSYEAGPIEDAPGETWSGINTALRRARRGLPTRREGSSLAKLLDRYRRDWGWSQTERRTKTLQKT